MAISQAMKVGIIVERRESDNQWIDHTWQAVSIIPGVPDMDQSGAGLINLNCNKAGVAMRKMIERAVAAEQASAG